ncbi:NAD(P)/FAD-dependent oxidoreductase [Synoicihabitans lomoniglobus]|uniref:NADH:ubiquinone reductase (non-electrogenic) n=1 Tax=Synoicihabitans lomoniglobus TaxID=2909285 RepID=A0AAE9ZU27_9BACT|nr:NAD(P)/FAD-dependent oxidoreductase [Opitutaceae bacterium LMO-M01]WED63044.1 NAD(P)/FAD-dependent oxidoreductase [Opitutaceae bacterium LMO-M01]
MSQPSSSRLPHVVVLGAGFGGLRFAQDFDSRRARVTVVDRQNHHLFQPLLYQVATAGLAAPDIAQPIRSLLKHKPNLEVRLAEVTGIDLAQRRVHLDRGELSYDYLVIALGGRTTYFGRPEWEQHAPGIKSLDDAMRVRREVLLAYERAEREDDPVRRRDLMTTVVVGGGPTGVELAGSLAELARKVMRRDFDRIDPREARIILVEGSDAVLGAFPPDLAASARRQLEKMGVEVRTGVRVTDLRRGEVHIGDEVLRAGTVLWGAGVGAAAVTQSLGIALDRAGRIPVNPDLSVPGHSDVFAVGDLTTLKDANGQIVPGVAQGAIQGAAFVADVLNRSLQSGVPSDPARRPAFAYRDKGNMATIGRRAAIAQIGRIHLQGLPAWLAWLALHLFFLVGFRNRLSVLLQWTYSYFSYKRGARIIMGMDQRGSPAESLVAAQKISVQE